MRIDDIEKELKVYAGRFSIPCEGRWEDKSSEYNTKLALVAELRRLRAQALLWFDDMIHFAQEDD